MDRRKLLQSLLALPVLAIPVAAMEVKPKITNGNGDLRTHDGWVCYWSDWKQIDNAEHCVGHWCARSSDDRFQKQIGNQTVWLMAYSSYPGAVGWYSQRQIFDTSFKEDQRIISLGHSPQKELNAAMEQAFKKLVDFLDSEPIPDYWK